MAGVSHLPFPLGMVPNAWDQTKRVITQPVVRPACRELSREL